MYVLHSWTQSLGLENEQGDLVWSKFLLDRQRSGNNPISPGPRSPPDGAMFLVLSVSKGSEHLKTPKNMNGAAIIESSTRPALVHAPALELQASQSVPPSK